jgi:hypothetical protein
VRTFLVLTLALLLLPVSLLLCASSVAASSPDPGHVANLPPLSAGTLLDAAPGEPPSPAHPRGTVLVAASLARCGPAVYEWDVARSRVTRAACLGGGQADVRVARRGGVLLVLTVGPDVVLRPIDIASFQVTGRTRLGEFASSGIAADDGLTAVLSGPPLGSYADTFTVTTLDAAGHVLARVTSPGKKDWGPDPRVVVLAHRAFLVLDADGPRDPRPRLVAIDATAHVVGSLALDATTASTPPIAAKNDRLLVALGREVLEVSPQLAVLARHPVGTHGPLAVAQDGRVLTGSGEVLSNDFSPVGQLSGTEAWEHAVLWVGSTPVVVGTEAEVVSGARIHWWEP